MLFANDEIKCEHDNRDFLIGEKGASYSFVERIDYCSNFITETPQFFGVPAARNKNGAVGTVPTNWPCLNTMAWNMIMYIPYTIYAIHCLGWTNQSMPQPVPNPDRRGGLASGASRL